MRTNVTRQFRSRERNVHYAVVSFPEMNVHGNETSRGYLFLLGLGLCCDKISNVNETENNSGELTDKYRMIPVQILRSGLSVYTACSSEACRIISLVVNWWAQLKSCQPRHNTQKVV